MSSRLGATTELEALTVAISVRENTRTASLPAVIAAQIARANGAQILIGVTSQEQSRIFYPYADQIVVGDATSISKRRNLLYERAHTPWIYFLDDDVGPTPGLWQKLPQLLSVPAAYGGLYISPRGSGVWRRAYNSCANLWMRTHDDLLQPVVVAGNVLLPRQGSCERDFPFRPDVPFGGEEVHLVSRLRELGVQVVLAPELAAEHHCNVNAWRFFQRARLHGRSPQQPDGGFRAWLIYFRHWWALRSIRVQSLVLVYNMVMRWSRGVSRA